MVTRKQIDRFVKRRNKSDFNTNLQFQIDANACGFRVDDICNGQPPQRLLLEKSFIAHQWKFETDEGPVRMIEFGNLLYVNYHLDANSEKMFEIANEAEYPAEKETTPEGAAS